MLYYFLSSLNQLEFIKAFFKISNDLFENKYDEKRYGKCRKRTNF